MLRTPHVLDRAAAVEVGLEPDGRGALAQDVVREEDVAGCRPTSRCPGRCRPRRPCRCRGPPRARWGGAIVRPSRSRPDLMTTESSPVRKRFFSISTYGLESTSTPSLFGKWLSTSQAAHGRVVGVDEVVDPERRVGDACSPRAARACRRRSARAAGRRCVPAPKTRCSTGTPSKPIRRSRWKSGSAFGCQAWKPLSRLPSIVPGPGDRHVLDVAGVDQRRVASSPPCLPSASSPPAGSRPDRARRAGVRPRRGGARCGSSGGRGPWRARRPGRARHGRPGRGRLVDGGADGRQRVRAPVGDAAAPGDVEHARRDPRPLDGGGHGVGLVPQRVGPGRRRAPASRTTRRGSAPARSERRRQVAARPGRSRARPRASGPSRA